eukprot:c30582_g1_i1 orf=169-408(-)
MKMEDARIQIRKSQEASFCLIIANHKVTDSYRHGKEELAAVVFLPASKGTQDRFRSVYVHAGKHVNGQSPPSCTENVNI